MSTTSTAPRRAEPARSEVPSRLAALIGVLAVGAAIDSGQLVASLVSPASSPVLTELQSNTELPSGARWSEHGASGSPDSEARDGAGQTSRRNVLLGSSVAIGVASLGDVEVELVIADVPQVAGPVACSAPGTRTRLAVGRDRE